MLVRLKRSACGLPEGAVCEVYPLTVPGLYEISGVLFGGTIESAISCWSRMVVQGDIEVLDDGKVQGR